MKTKPRTYESIVQLIKEQIQTAQYGPGQRLPSERQLATEFGVSRAVVQDAIKQLELQGIIERQPNCRPTVRKLDTKNPWRSRPGKDMIGVWLHPSLEDPGAATILQSIRTSLGVAGYQTLIGCSSTQEWLNAPRYEAGFLRSLIENHSTAGAIVWHTGGDDFHFAYQQLMNAGIPVVFIDREAPEPIEADLVATNHRRAAKTAVKHLIEMGHRRIAMVLNNDPASSVHDRIDGYRSALQDAGIDFRPDYIVNLPLAYGQTAREDADMTVVDLLKKENPPTAIFAVNDQIALFLDDAIRNLGIKIPEEMSLVGFDWNLRWLPSGGHLTTVCQNFDLIGRLATERLLNRIASPKTEAVQHVLVEAPLVLRGTTAAPRRHDTLRQLQGELLKAQ